LAPQALSKKSDSKAFQQNSRLIISPNEFFGDAVPPNTLELYLDKKWHPGRPKITLAISTLKHSA
jgi:hypothetical protein